jgi:antitoxin PrlF
MSTSKVTKKWQLTLPLDVRHRLGINAGDLVEFVELADGGFAIKPVADDVSALKGLLRKPTQAISTADMREAVRHRSITRKDRPL